jgi:hypothetical protein
VRPPVSVFRLLHQLRSDFLVLGRENLARIGQSLVAVVEILHIFLILVGVKVLHRAIVVLVERPLFGDVLGIRPILVVVDFLFRAPFTFLLLLAVARLTLVIDDFSFVI